MAATCPDDIGIKLLLPRFLFFCRPLEQNMALTYQRSQRSNRLGASLGAAARQACMGQRGLAGREAPLGGKTFPPLASWRMH